MRKLTLDPEMLRVESFSTAEDASTPRGTVEAHSYLSKEWGACSEPSSQYCEPTDHHLNTCGVSCVDACFPSDYC